MSICEVYESLKIQTMEKLSFQLQNLKIKLQELRGETTRVSPVFIQFSDFFWCDKFFALLGYSVLNNSLKSEKSHRNVCLVTLAMTMIFTILIQISLVRSVLNLMDGDNLTIAMENFSFTGGVVLMFLKWYMLLHRSRERIRKIVEKLDEHYPHSGVDQIDFNTEKYLRRLQTFKKYHFIMVWITYANFTLMPISRQIYGWLTSINIPWEHVFAINLPFDTMNGLFYWPNLLFMFWFIITNGLIFCGTDMLCSTLTYLVTMELNILAQIMAEIDDEDEEKALSEMKKLAGIHQQLIEVTDELNNISSPLLFVNAFSCLTMLCIAAVLAATGEGHYFMVKYVVPVLFVAWQFYVQCYFGNAMSDASLRVAEGVYNSDWYKRSPKYRRTALLVMMRAQKAQKLTGWKFFDINLETYYWFIQTAHSYYSFLCGVHKS